MTAVGRELPVEVVSFSLDSSKYNKNPRQQLRQMSAFLLNLNTNLGLDND
jgi:hypothetical protein